MGLRLKTLSIVPVIAFFLFLPLVERDPYILHVLIEIGMVSLPALGLRLIMLTGQLSFGQVAFLAIGAYTSSLLVMKMGMNSWFTLPISGFMAALGGVAIGYPALRIKGAYFAILTLALGEAVSMILLNWTGLTGGADGIFGIPRPNDLAMAGSTLVHFTADKLPYYYYVLALLIFCMLVMYRLDRSHVGAILRAISQSDTLAESFGVNITRYKVFAFSIGCFFAGLGGAFYAHYFTILHPDSFTLWDSIFYVVYVIVGGSNSVVGPVLGSFLMLGTFELLRAAKKFQAVTYALIFIFVILFLPGGLMNLRQILFPGRSPAPEAAEEKHETNLERRGEP